MHRSQSKHALLRAASRKSARHNRLLAQKLSRGKLRPTTSSATLGSTGDATSPLQRSASDYAFEVGAFGEETTALPGIQEISLRRTDFPGTKVGRRAIRAAQHASQKTAHAKAERRYLARRKHVPRAEKRATTNLPRWLLRRQDFQVRRAIDPL